MRLLLIPMMALAAPMTLSACGGSEVPGNDVAVENSQADRQNEIHSIEAMPNDTAATDEPEPPASQSGPAQPKAPASDKPAIVEPAEPQSKPTEPAEPKTTSADCTPEHRAAGHC